MSVEMHCDLQIKVPPFLWTGSCRLPGDVQWQRYDSGVEQHIKDEAYERSALPLNIE